MAKCPKCGSRMQELHPKSIRLIRENGMLSKHQREAVEWSKRAPSPRARGFACNKCEIATVIDHYKV